MGETLGVQVSMVYNSLVSITRQPSLMRSLGRTARVDVRGLRRLLHASFYGEEAATGSVQGIPERASKGRPSAPVPGAVYTPLFLTNVTAPVFPNSSSGTTSSGGTTITCQAPVNVLHSSTIPVSSSTSQSVVPSLPSTSKFLGGGAGAGTLLPSTSQDSVPLVIDLPDTEDDRFVNDETTSGEYSSSVVTIYQSGGECDSNWSRDSEDYPLEEWCLRKRTTQAARLGHGAGLRKSTRKRKCVDRYVGGAADDPIVLQSGTDSVTDDISWGGVTETTQDSDPNAAVFIIPGVAPQKTVASAAIKDILNALTDYAAMGSAPLLTGCESPASVNSQEVVDPTFAPGLGARSDPLGKLLCMSCCFLA